MALSTTLSPAERINPESLKIMASSQSGQIVCNCSTCCTPLASRLRDASYTTHEIVASVDGARNNEPANAYSAKRAGSLLLTEGLQCVDRLKGLVDAATEPGELRARYTNESAQVHETLASASSRERSSAEGHRFSHTWRVDVGSESEMANEEADAGGRLSESRENSKEKDSGLAC